MNKKTLKFDREELDILRNFEKDEYKSIRSIQKEKKDLEKSAVNTFSKDKRINIRISSRDLNKIRKKAVREGIPYQTLISSTLHKYVNGQITEKSNSTSSS